MISKLISGAAGLLGLGVLLAACNMKAPRQAEAADALNEKGGADMSHGEDGSGNMKAIPVDEKAAEKMQDKCCGQCKAAMAKDRTGQPATAIPCSDFTADLDPFCLEHFRGKKTMAAACK